MIRSILNLHYSLNIKNGMTGNLHYSFSKHSDGILLSPRICLCGSVYLIPLGGFAYV